MLVSLCSGNFCLATEVAALIGADVPPYQEAIEGFRKTSKLKIDIVYDMKGDFEVAKRIVETIDTEIRPKLIYAVGVWALQAVMERKSNTPVVYAMVLNPPSLIDLAISEVTGASMNIKVSDTFNLIRELNPEIRRVETIFNQNNTGFLVDEAKRMSSKYGFELVAVQINSSREAMSALQTLENEKIDILWLLPDKDVLGKEFVEQIMLYSFREKVPVIGYSTSQVKMGALLALSLASGEDIGRQAGELANQLQSGGPGAVPQFTFVRDTALSINKKTVEKLQILIPTGLLERANRVIE